MYYKKEDVQKTIEKHVLMAMGAGAIPIPVLDLGVVTYIQLDMINALNKIYDVPYEKVQLKSLIVSLTGGLLSRTGAGFIKVVPIIGPVIGSYSMAIFSGTTTYALGKVYCRTFEEHSSWEEVDISTLKKMFRDEFRKGKAEVKRWFKNSSTN